ncbi:COG3650 family protein [Pseudomonas sp. 5P_3.1_Bac2]|uniref:COG3650 family protein n=1 Tax=Pseudomonas sp. 5P_3.1_Bac2 TaxID=2971617 RepID=UPI0021C8DC1A|nr:hypothetical protein [Pseudomonas sp. 5P_3.1_Bac2]MCU1716106.1 hypothetical protein [Pseudomonas sp. 5P_3.1_Bac2]
MRLHRPLCLTLLALLAGCQSTGNQTPDATLKSTRLQGELSQSASDLIFRPCQEQRQFVINDSAATDPNQDSLSSDAQTLFADGRSKLFVDLRGQLKASASKGHDGELLPTQVYRVQGEGPGCNDINFKRTLLSAHGNEPNWHVAVSSQGLILSRPGQEDLALPYVEEQLPEGRFNLSSEANGQRFELWVAKQRCVDSMSGTVQNMSAELRLDGKVMRGCAYQGGGRDN